MLLREYQNQRDLLALFQPEVRALGCDLLGIESYILKRKLMLRVYIDKQEGVGIDDCALVSGQLSALLDVKQYFKQDYILEISSPGPGRLLFSSEQFEKYIGSNIKIQLYNKKDGRRFFLGKLIEIEHTYHIILECEGKPVTLSFDLIKQARLVS